MKKYFITIICIIMLIGLCNAVSQQYRGDYYSTQANQSLSGLIDQDGFLWLCISGSALGDCWLWTDSAATTLHITGTLAVTTLSTDILDVTNYITNTDAGEAVRIYDDGGVDVKQIGAAAETGDFFYIFPAVPALACPFVCDQFYGLDVELQTNAGSIGGTTTYGINSEIAGAGNTASEEIAYNASPNWDYVFSSPIFTVRGDQVAATSQVLINPSYAITAIAETTVITDIDATTPNNTGGTIIGMRVNQSANDTDSVDDAISVNDMWDNYLNTASIDLKPNGYTSYSGTVASGTNWHTINPTLSAQAGASTEDIERWTFTVPIMVAGNIFNGIEFTPTMSNDTGGTFNGIKFNNVTNDANSIYTAISCGTGYDSCISAQSPIYADRTNLIMSEVTAPTAPTVALGAAGVLTGAYYYRITFVTANGETESGTVSVIINPAAQIVELTNIPVSADTTVTQRKIYRCSAGGGSLVLKLVDTLPDNVTTIYSDNIADGALGVAAPTMNTTGARILNAGVVTGITGTLATAWGLNAMSVNKGYYNTGIGTSALYANSTGANNTGIGTSALYANSTGYNNTAIGSNALKTNSTGSYNTGIGYLAGYNAGVPLQTNSNSVFLGYNANTSVNALTNVIVLGYNAQATASNQVILGNTSITDIITTGAFSNPTALTPVTVTDAHGFRVGNVAGTANWYMGLFDMTIPNMAVGQVFNGIRIDPAAEGTHSGAATFNAVNIPDTVVTANLTQNAINIGANFTTGLRMFSPFYNFSTSEFVGAMYIYGNANVYDDSYLYNSAAKPVYVNDTEGLKVKYAVQLELESAIGTCDATAVGTLKCVAGGAAADYCAMCLQDADGIGGAYNWRTFVIGD